MATVARVGRADIADFIERNTYLGGRLFSFKGHEYQRRILMDESPSIVVHKSAQTGISEMSLRLAATLPVVMPGTFNLGYVLPTASFATSYAQTRFNPIVQSSPVLRSYMTSDDIDRADIKTFSGGGSVSKAVYFKGAAVGNAAISTSLDMVIYDEYSFMDQDVAGDYNSRLIHSPYKWDIKLSTPTFPGDPIDRAFEASRRHFNMCRCMHCQHIFLPNYYEHVHVPGWSKALDEINEANLHTTRYLEAQLLCPKCKRPANLLPEHREWVCENNEEQHVAAGFKVQPFDAPTVVTIPGVVLASTKYTSKAKFMQFSLGTPAADADAGITEEDVIKYSAEIGTSPCTSHFMGIDQGNTCYLMVGGLDSQGRLVVMHYERAALGEFKRRRDALQTKYRAGVKVIDQQPNVSLAMEMAEQDGQCYPAIYTTKSGMEIYDVRSREAEMDEGIMALRQVSINRNALFDRILLDLREGRIVFNKCPDWQLLITHLTDMKRAQATLRNGEFTSLWQKSAKGNDHFHHALGYLWIAAQLRGIGSSALTPGMFGVRTFRMKSQA